MIGHSLPLMREDPTPSATVRFSFDVDLEYNPFTGRTLEKFLELVEDEFFDAIQDLRPEIIDVYNMQSKVIKNV